MEIHPIGILHSPYKQKFAIPRQPNLVPAGIGTIELLEDYSDPNCLREIGQFSHLWLVFQFHGTAAQGWSPTVQPPRLGGQERVGVFASRSPFRPNSLGISVVKYLDHQRLDNKTEIRVGGIDLLDKTPILDIKPYIPYVDAISNAAGGYAEKKPPQKFEVLFSQETANQLSKYSQRYPQLKDLIVQILALDPRPSWRVRDNDCKQYGMTLYDLNIKWRAEKDHIAVIGIHAAESFD